MEQEIATQNPHPAFLNPLPKPCKRPRPATPVCRLTQSQRLLILGGTGRVGFETAVALAETPNLSVTLASHRRRKDARPSFPFTPVDITSAEALSDVIKQHDIVLHTAGPFQNSPTPALVLETCLSLGKPYLDICDDTTHSTATKSLHHLAISRNIPALISTGIYPGLSNLLSAIAVTQLQERVPKVEALDLYYHTAGSGGIGESVLASTMLLLSESAEEHTPHGAVSHPAASGIIKVDFGELIGVVDTYRLNLPEVSSLHTYLCPTAKVSARFSTAPPIWNLLLQGMARLPSSLLSNRTTMQALAKFSMPVVKAVDRISGAATAIVVKASGGGKNAVVRFECERLDRYVGLSTAAFVKAVLQGGVEPGVWFPEELGDEARRNIVAEAVGNGKLEVFVDGMVVQKSLV